MCEVMRWLRCARKRGGAAASEASYGALRTFGEESMVTDEEFKSVVSTPSRHHEVLTIAFSVFAPGDASDSDGEGDDDATGGGGGSTARAPSKGKAAKKNSEIFMVRTTVHLLMNAARAASLDLGLAMQLDGTARINIEGLPILFTGVMDVAQVWGDTTRVTRITPPLPGHSSTITRPFTCCYSTITHRHITVSVRLRCQHFHFVAAALVDSENTAQIEAFLVASMKYVNKTVEILKEIDGLELLKIGEIDDPMPPPTEARLALLKSYQAHNIKDFGPGLLTLAYGVSDNSDAIQKAFEALGAETINCKVLFKLNYQTRKLQVKQILRRRDRPTDRSADSLPPSRVSRFT